MFCVGNLGLLEYAPVPRIVRGGIYKNIIVWLQDFREKKIWTLYEISRNPGNSRNSGYLLTVPYLHVSTQNSNQCFTNVLL